MGVDTEEASGSLWLVEGRVETLLVVGVQTSSLWLVEGRLEALVEVHVDREEEASGSLRMVEEKLVTVLVGVDTQSSCPEVHGASCHTIILE